MSDLTHLEAVYDRYDARGREAEQRGDYTSALKFYRMRDIANERIGKYLAQEHLDD